MPGGNNLVPAHPGNTNAARHGLYSAGGRVLQPRAQEIADALMAAGHVVELDRTAAEEIGSLVALVEAIDKALAQRGVTGRGSQSLLDARLRASGRLQRWLDRFGATPAARAEWAAALAHGGLADEIARRRAATGGDDGRAAC